MRHNPRPMKSIAAVAAVVTAATAGLSACTGQQDPDLAAEVTRSTSQASVPSGDNRDLVNPAGAIRDLSGVTCEAAADGVWSASGKLTNTSTEQATYLVSFRVIRSKTSEVLGERSDTVEIGPGESEEVAFDALYKGDKKGLQCVPRVVKGDAP